MQGVAQSAYGDVRPSGVYGGAYGEARSMHGSVYGEARSMHGEAQSMHGGVHGKAQSMHGGVRGQFPLQPGGAPPMHGGSTMSRFVQSDASLDLQENTLVNRAGPFARHTFHDDFEQNMRSNDHRVGEGHGRFQQGGPDFQQRARFDRRNDQDEWRRQTVSFGRRQRDSREDPEPCYCEDCELSQREVQTPGSDVVLFRRKRARSPHELALPGDAWSSIEEIANESVTRTVLPILSSITARANAFEQEMRKVLSDRESVQESYNLRLNSNIEKLVEKVDKVR